MGKFDGILICTDLDGTLFRNDKTISDENIKAIEYFKSEGGYFTFVTGRMPFYFSEVTEAVKPNAPVGCMNGGGLYDTVKGEYIWNKVISDKVLELASLVDENFPDVGIMVPTLDRMFFCKESKAAATFRKLTKLENLVCHYNDIKEPKSRIVFAIDNYDEVVKIENMLKKHPLYNEFEFVGTEKIFYEVLPKGIGKGVAIEKLCDFLHVDVRKTVAIGDYYNDVSMFRKAGIGIAVDNACDDVKAAADFVTVSNEEHAIARVIYDIEAGKYNI